MWTQRHPLPNNIAEIFQENMGFSKENPSYSLVFLASFGRGPAFTDLPKVLSGMRFKMPSIMHKSIPAFT